MYKDVKDNAYFFCREIFNILSFNDWFFQIIFKKILLTNYKQFIKCINMSIRIYFGPLITI
jgi:hypothetical protein